MKEKRKKQKLQAPEAEPSETGSYHVPVLLKECLEGLQLKPAGIYVDVTFGGGGHSKAILEALSPAGRLIAFDQDSDAAQNLPDDKRLLFLPQNFRYVQRFLRLHGIDSVDGLLADLGVSSHQFDEGSRGFSTRYNAELDMRMDRRQAKTAFEVVQTYSEQHLHHLFEQYGEVTNSKTLAKAIVAARETTSLKTTEAFKNALRSNVRGNPAKYFAQVFQALRIEVNEEMEALKELLMQSKLLLKPKGRIAVITFHSIEDRLVKVFFKNGSFEASPENPFSNAPVESEFRVITKKPITASEEERKANPRSRSAKLRVAERI